MHIRVTISAVIGASRKTQAISASLNDQKEFRLDFPKDIDWDHSIYLILEPDDETVYKAKYLRGKALTHGKNYGMALETASKGEPTIPALTSDKCDDCGVVLPGPHLSSCEVQFDRYCSACDWESWEGPHRSACSGEEIVLERKKKRNSILH